jgi:hypothetical protein
MSKNRAVFSPTGGIIQDSHNTSPVFHGSNIK